MNKILSIIVIISVLLLAAGAYFWHKSQVKPTINAAMIDTAVDRGIMRYIKKQKKIHAEEVAEKNNLQQQEVKNLTPLKARDHIRGNKNAHIILFEYSDFECPYCKSFHSTMQKLLEKNKNIAWIYRHYPLDFHNPAATTKAIAAECVAILAGNNKFWAYTDALYDRRLNKNNLEQELLQLALKNNVKAKPFSDCVKQNKMQEIVATDTEEGHKSGIRGTPGTIIFNTKTGKKLFLSGAVPISHIEQAIKEVE